jgi:uncharacterized protein (TIGR02217 family)
MSDAIFPALPGLTWDSPKIPEFSTTLVKGRDGSETPIANWVYPLWRWTLTYELLRDDATDELKTLLGFFLARQGRADPFLYDDPNDNAVTGQQIGTGNGVVKQFQCVRDLGGFLEPIFNIKAAPTVYVDGVEATSGWSVSRGLITFETAPEGVITADFGFWWRVRFDMDAAEFNEFAYQLWELRECKLVSKRRQ